MSHNCLQEGIDNEILVLLQLQLREACLREACVHGESKGQIQCNWK